MFTIENLIQPTDDFVQSFPGLGFNNHFRLSTMGEPLLVTDPIYIADVYNIADDDTTFLRNHGVFLMGFGGDINCPVLWKSPFLILPIHNGESYAGQCGMKTLATEIVCDSGSLLFLPYKCLPKSVAATVHELLQDNNAWLLKIPSGHWTFFYEQYSCSNPNHVGLYRNIVAKHRKHGI